MDVFASVRLHCHGEYYEIQTVWVGSLGGRGRDGPSFYEAPPLSHLDQEVRKRKFRGFTEFMAAGLD